MSRISEYAALTSPALGDEIPAVDVSDISMASSGTDKKMTVSALLTSARNIMPAALAVPDGSLATWQAATAQALAGTGTATMALMGDSGGAGQSGGTVVDALKYGFAGRMDTALSAEYGAYAEGYMIASVAPGTLTSPSSPYTQLGSYTAYDGGVGQVWSANTSNSAFVTFTVPVHPVTGATPLTVDLLTLDYNNGSAEWEYTVDGGSAVTVSTAGLQASGGVIRRTLVSLTGSAPHTIVLTQLVTSGLAFMGHVVYYSTTAGFGFIRNAIPGFKAIDFATGLSTSGGSNGSLSLTPDKFKPWSGVNDTYNIAGSTFPFGGIDLAIIELGSNDCIYGAHPAAFRRSLQRAVSAFRRGNPATGSSYGASIIMTANTVPSPYSDNAGVTDISPAAVNGVNWTWPVYRGIIADVAAANGCVFADFGEIFGETAVARGLQASGNIHPTQDGQGAGGGDGHQLIADVLLGLGL